MLMFWFSLFVVGLVCATALYALARRLRLMAVVDLLWTFGLGLAALAYLIELGMETVRAYAVCLLIILWSFRLSAHLLTDRILRGKEDPRYVNLAQYWGAAATRNFYFLFLGQILLVALFLWPITVAMASPGPWRLLDWLAVGIAVVALSGETLADWQLSLFRSEAENQGQVCCQGLWRYSRHPNYFFEWLHWWAYVVFAWGAIGWWQTLVGPVAMYVFLRYLTGIPHAERSSVQRRGQAYRDYQKSTNLFFPWKPHKPQS